MIYRVKLARYFLALFLILSLNFAIPRMMPGDTMTNLLGEDVYFSGAAAEAMREKMGLDQPLSTQYIGYMKALGRLDLGYSYHFRSPVTDLLWSRMRWTLFLVLPSIVMGALLGTYLGALAGWDEGRGSRRLQTLAAIAIYSSPPYFISLVAVYILGFKLGWFPLKGVYLTGDPLNVLHHLFLPVVIMTLFAASRNFMIMRGSVIQEKRSLYVSYARAKGLFQDEILFASVFKNALLPIITLIALDFGFIFSGALFIEIVFSMNGMGLLIYDAVLCRDYPVLQGAMLIITVMVIIANILADLIYGVVDPRVRSGGGGGW